MIITPKFDNATKQLQVFLKWLFGKQTQCEMPAFLNQVTVDENGQRRPTHERFVKVRNSLIRLICDGALFTYLDEELLRTIEKISSTNNQIEGSVNARLRAMLRDHRGLNIERRIKAAFWWCYMHSPEPLSAKELLKVMPTDRSIAGIYKRLSPQKKIESSILTWGDAIVWSELHRTTPYPELWS